MDCASVVNGIVSLNDFRPHTYFHAKPAYVVGGAYPLVPADLATIFGLNALFGAGMVVSTCIFYDITRGDMSVNCTGNINCYLPSVQ